MIVEERHARVVHEYVDVTHLGVGALGELLDLAPLADVRGDRQRAPTGLALDVLGGRLARVELAARDHHVRARARERPIA